jgi:hypothetical protein
MSSDDSQTSSDDEQRCTLDEFGRPISRPIYSSIGTSSVLSRVREFLPQFKASVVKSSFDPQILQQDAETTSIILQRPRSSSVSSTGSLDSESSFGVEIEVGCGVFDVTGTIDEEALVRENIPTLSFNVVNNNDDAEPIRDVLIQEIEKH